ncbi:hypothetical protein BO82DRAFT_126096 [Aspergillus uvarum CBS 121591]|uniref:Uncharacterized protein n=1 Tax=Aspergillus uvarum CBS 121591 TaxID=1448315 RepID=A0A319C3K1_9EURO|nr:hypothetical protein BO82DRAFT_126096 [Aspergillus uvarum CBS 121591]PYH79705.1 hypothetical protein BO82DRAFT_126096 [Aspergillus uvarum CBS 121591]
MKHVSPPAYCFRLRSITFGIPELSCQYLILSSHNKSVTFSSSHSRPKPSIRARPPFHLILVTPNLCNHRNHQRKGCCDHEASKTKDFSHCLSSHLTVARRGRIHYRGRLKSVLRIDGRTARGGQRHVTNVSQDPHLLPSPFVSFFPAICFLHGRFSPPGGRRTWPE